MGKGMEILEAVTRLANIMGLRIIAEGIETKEQIDFLMNMGCTYGQGYYFFHPMPIEVFEPLLSDEDNIDFRGIRAKQIERVRLKDMLEEDIASDAMMNNILGPWRSTRYMTDSWSCCGLMNSTAPLQAPAQ